MQDLPPLQKLYLSYLGNLYAFTYRTRFQRIIGISRRSWLTLVLIILLLAGWIANWPGWLTILLLILLIWLRFSYWRAEKAGYSKFLVDKTAVSPAAPFEPLKPNERVKLRASGIFSTSSHDTTVLLRSAEYWKVPLGEHTIMVEQGSQTFLYQFFNKNTLEGVRSGWLIYGKQPRRALAITFCSKWGANFTDFGQLYYVRGRNNEPPCEQREIYFTFASDREHAAVWHNILQDFEGND